MYGNKGEKFKVHYENEHMTGEYETSFEGVINSLIRRYKETSSEYMRGEYETLMTNNRCPVCHGARLKKESLAVTIGSKNIAEVTDEAIIDIKGFLDGLKLSERQLMIGEQVLKEIKARINFLVDVGLDYLSLSRSAGTLSGGEAQRIRLATQIGSGLVGVVYILDEPSIGLHQRDNERLLATLKHLRDLGNTLIVVEHDEDTMHEADYIVDIGPGAGVHGGEIVYAGTVNGILRSRKSVTGKYLAGKKVIPLPKERRLTSERWLKVVGARENNLRDIDIDIPLGIFTCVTGVSGSGKSSFVNEILYKRLARDLNRSKIKPGKHSHIEGMEHLDKVIDIDQSPIGRTPRSNPATYTGVFDHIREILQRLRMRRSGGIRRAGSVSTSRAAAAKPAGVMVSSRSRCISFRIFTCLVKSVMESDITAIHWKSDTRARIYRKSLT